MALPLADICYHSSFLVNLAYVSGINSREIILSSGSRLALGCRYVRQFQSAFIHYLSSK